MSFKALPVKIERTAVKKPTEGGGGRGEEGGAPPRIAKF